MKILEPCDRIDSDLRKEVEFLKQNQMDLEVRMRRQFEQLRDSIDIRDQPKLGIVQELKISEHEAHKDKLSSPLASISYLATKKLLNIAEDMVVAYLIQLAMNRKSKPK